LLLLVRACQAGGQSTNLVQTHCKDDFYVPQRRQLPTATMQLELLSASNFLVHLVRLARRGVSELQLSRFHDCLIDVLRRRYRDHWFPEKPFKGSGYRCIRINGKFDPLIGEAGVACGLSTKFLHDIFPSELTLWVDPKEVSYRIGENGSICVLYEATKENNGEPWRPSNTNNTSTTSSSSSTTTTANNSHHNQQQHYHHQHNNKQQQRQLTSNQNINMKNQQQIVINSKGVNNTKKHGVHHLQQQHASSTTANNTAAANSPSCRSSMDYILDRKSVSIEQLAAFVSS